MLTVKSLTRFLPLLDKYIKNREQEACFLEGWRQGTKKEGSPCAHANVPDEMTSVTASVTVSIYTTNLQERPFSKNPPYMDP